MVFSDEEWVAIALSLKVAFAATAFSLPFGIAIAYLLARREFFGKSLLSAIVVLPLILPPVVTGYILLILFGKKGVMGHFLAETLGLVFSFRWTGAALAAGVMGFPMLVQAIRISMEAIDTRLIDAARTLGANPVAVFFTVTLPLAMPGILAGAVLCFARSLGEFGATITFVSAIPGQTQTLASAIHAALQDPDGEGQAWRLTLLSIALSVSAIVLSSLFSRFVSRRMGVHP